MAYSSRYRHPRALASAAGHPPAQGKRYVIAKQSTVRSAIRKKKNDDRFNHVATLIKVKFPKNSYSHDGWIAIFLSFRESDLECL